MTAILLLATEPNDLPFAMVYELPVELAAELATKLNGGGLRATAGAGDTILSTFDGIEVVRFTGKASETISAALAQRVHAQTRPFREGHVAPIGYDGDGVVRVRGVVAEAVIAA
jgi:hypothetical protein